MKTLIIITTILGVLFLTACQDNEQDKSQINSKNRSKYETRY